ncbi:hypothetical protein [Nocardia nova]|uniref:hypothetical protein n=1 Tax=Nocardia nova TaxID=37330 RepID=UPI0015E2C15F|nr:hypothetical protein [Nocardia nova]
MFRRKPTTKPVSSADLLVTADLPRRVQIAQDRLAHQDNPALVAALSEDELAADRAVAERLREHERTEKLAAIEASEATAAHVRKATSEIVRADARDLLLARRALADHHREGSAHAQLAKLYVVRKWSTRALAGVVIAAMLFSAVNVQHNLAPGGPGEPLYWASYALEALISTVLVVFMVSGSAVARWGITEGEDLIRWTEALLLAASIGLNTYPYLRDGDWYNVGVHSVAPIMIGVALVGHDAVSRRLGHAIALASAEAPAVDDIADRLAALHELGAATAHQTTTPAATATVARDETVAADRTDMDEFERDFTARDDAAADRAEQSSIAREPIARAAEEAGSIARDDIDRAPIARGDTDHSRAADDAAPVPQASAEVAADRTRIARDTVADRARAAAEAEPIAPEPAVDDRAPIAAHSPVELGTDRESIADHDTDTAPAEGEQDEPARDDSDRDRAAVVTLVRGNSGRPIARDNIDRAHTGRSSIAREPAIDGALARAADRAPIARDSAAAGVDRAPFDRALTRGEALDVARAVVDRGLSRQPIEMLARIYEARSQGDTANHIGKLVALPHSTVGRAIAAAAKVAGPRPVD